MENMRTLGLVSLDNPYSNVSTNPILQVAFLHGFGYFVCSFLGMRHFFCIFVADFATLFKRERRINPNMITCLG